ncbi:hypothetical protein PtA15_7A163 [Puccinia triticina]|uniref:Uncharacterized protein n=1 Tax=Puccinia triticina TaxID=208348 RepID=A0ABY7CPN3_9BASI|nr:uncharacterized protein PtA15_7A163 [Puccinia triticina]WAQ86437.1 hypothetical protein PtA15_7A163 [Puccinia triticina]
MTISSQQCSSSSPVDLLTNLHDATINPQPSVQTSAVRDGWNPTNPDTKYRSNQPVPLTQRPSPGLYSIQRQATARASCSHHAFAFTFIPTGPTPTAYHKALDPALAAPTTSPPDHEALGPAPPAARSPTNATSPASSSNQFMNHRHQQPRLQPARITQLGPNNLLHLLLARY